MIPFKTITFDVEDQIATIVLNRPEKLNAINPVMMQELIEAVDRSDADDSVRVLIVTGRGRAFCAGSDLSGGSFAFDFQARDSATRDEAVVNGVYRDSGGRVALRLFESLKPVIGAINGPAVGAGATIPLAMDIRLAADTARFGYVFARRGIVPESAAAWFLPRVVGISTALEWCFSGKLIDAEEAQLRGLVRSIHSVDTLLLAARTLAREIAENTAPVSITLTRQMLWRMLGADHPMAAHRLDSRLVQSRGRSPDAAEGVASFLEHRRPSFTDRVSTDLPEEFPWWRDEPFI